MADKGPFLLRSHIHSGLESLIDRVDGKIIFESPGKVLCVVSSPVRVFRNFGKELTRIKSDPERSGDQDCYNRYPLLRLNYLYQANFVQDPRKRGVSQ